MVNIETFNPVTPTPTPTVTNTPTPTITPTPSLTPNYIGECFTGAFSGGLPGNGLLVYDVNETTDGYLLVSGNYSRYNNPLDISSDGVTKISKSGVNQYISFNQFNFPYTAYTQNTIQSDNKIVLWGRFNTWNSLTKNNIVRLNADGTEDGSFSSGSGFTRTDAAEPTVQDLKQQSSGKLIVVTYSNRYNGSVISRSMCRLNTDGTLDNTFVPFSGYTQYFGNICVTSDDKIIVLGIAGLGSIVRLNSDGSLDNTFTPFSATGDPSLGGGTPTDIIQQSDGKILIYGLIRPGTGTTRKGIFRLNSDGTLDTSFNPSAGAGIGGGTLGTTPYPGNVVIQSDGKYVIAQNGGTGVTYNGTIVKSVYRLNTDGTLDTSFSTNTVIPTTGSNTIVRMTQTSNYFIYVYGNFTSYDGNTVGRIVRIKNDGTYYNC